MRLRVRFTGVLIVILVSFLLLCAAYSGISSSYFSARSVSDPVEISIQD